MDFKNFFDKSPLCIFIIDNDDYIIYNNEKFKNLINKDINNIKCKDLLGWSIKEYINFKKSENFQIENIIIDENNNIKNILINTRLIENNIICYCTDITNIKKYNDNMKIALIELEESKRKAEMMDNLKSSFLANVSHEIRTPLNSIIGFSRLLINANKGDKSKYIKIIENNSDLLLHLIDDIIDLSKIENNEINIKNNKCILYDIITELYNTYKYKTKDDVKLVIDQDLTNIIIYTDEYRLKQILNNIISNAIKFTENGYIKFGYKLRKNVIIFYVEDTGIGIDKKNHEYVFERFTQLDEKDSKNYKGTGLGLSICNKLVNLLGGKIWLKSKLNKGTTFYFTIPSDYIQKINNEYDNINKNGKVKTNWKNKKILIIDNDDYSSLLLVKLIEKTEIKYDIAKLGLYAIKYIESQDYNLIILDIDLPDIHGYELVKKIKEIKNIPVIAQTSLAIVNSKIDTLKNGFDDYMIKPIQTYNLIKMLNKYLN